MTHIYAVHEVNEYLNELVSNDPFFSQIIVQGEISNWTKASSGHCYFTLKDTFSEIRCVMWRSAAQMLTTLPRNGDAVVVTGNISVYVERGQYQLYAELIQPVGVGVLFQRFEALKHLLSMEGLFDEGRKKPLPAFPKRIGIVTSPTTAALQDILNILRRRQPLTEVILSPTAVQGSEAPDGIVRALARLEAAGVDVIIVARGGGSIEDLWAFNEEIVARAMSKCGIPIISGVGHEIDFTIADFVADRRAPTPSAAAEVAVPDIRELRDHVEECREALDLAMDGVLYTFREQQVQNERRLARLAPIQRIYAAQQRVDEWESRLQRQTNTLLQLSESRLQGIEGRLANLNPAATLARGYAIVTHAETGQIISSAQNVVAGDDLEIRFGDGIVGANAKGTTSKGTRKRKG
jgi:exodeoxyribonuclease VII large subunit